MIPKKLNEEDVVEIHTKQNVAEIKSEDHKNGYKSIGKVVGVTDSEVYKIKFESTQKDVTSITKLVKLDQDPQVVMAIEHGDEKLYTITKVKIIGNKAEYPF